MAPDPRRLFSGGRPRRTARALTRAADVAVQEVLAVQEGERVLVLTEPAPEVSGLAQAVHDAAVRAGGDVTLVAQAPRPGGGPAEPIVRRALETDPQVLCSITTGPIGADPERIARPAHDRYTHYAEYLIGEGRSRGFWSPGVSRRDFERLVAVDHAALARDAKDLKEILAATVELRVETAGGAELILPIDGARAVAETGRYDRPGTGGNLPAGELVVPVKDGGANGRFVVDATLGLPTGSERVRHPVILEIEEGVATGASGGPLAAGIRDAFQAGVLLAEKAVAAGSLTRRQAAAGSGNVRKVAELGFGLNPAARLTGRALVDEKVRGTVHLVIGAGAVVKPAGAMVSVHAVPRMPRVVAVLHDGSEVAVVERASLPMPKVAGLARVAA